MPKIRFTPSNLSSDIAANTKILLAARKAQVPIRFGCASCRCGTCAVKVSNPKALSPANQDEVDLLKRMKLESNGSVRLACQARVLEDITVDIAFQDTYSPDDGSEYE
jgi:ferredoxin